MPALNHSPGCSSPNPSVQSTTGYPVSVRVARFLLSHFALWVQNVARYHSPAAFLKSATNNAQEVYKPGASMATRLTTIDWVNKVDG
jgi:hypothetical protein